MTERENWQAVREALKESVLAAAFFESDVRVHGMTISGLVDAQLRTAEAWSELEEAIRRDERSKWYLSAPRTEGRANA